MKTLGSLPLTPTVVRFTATASIRYVNLADEDRRVVYIIAADVCNALGINDDNRDAIICYYVEKTERIRLAIDDNGKSVPHFVLTEKGAQQLTVMCNNSALGDKFSNWIKGGIESYSRIFNPSGYRKTRWGKQPILEFVNRNGYTLKSFAKEANDLNLPNVGSFNDANFNSWVYGHCLPRESLIQRACVLLNVQPIDLFTEEVLAACIARDRGDVNG